MKNHLVTYTTKVLIINVADLGQIEINLDNDHNIMLDLSTQN